MFIKTASIVVRLLSMLMLFTLMAGVPFVHAAGILYVAPNGTGDCSTWMNACILQVALTNAVSGDEVWVAAGTHKPATGVDRSATFQLKSGVALYGGFAGRETARSQRNPMVNATILSGDLSGDDAGFANNEENVYHVVTGAAGAILDGFTITAGNANGADPNNSGGGMYNPSDSNSIVANVNFSGNQAMTGGGMDNYFSSPTLTNVTFSGNSANLGGGMNNFSSSPTLTNSTFSGNSASYGGGMYNNSGSPTLTNVTFKGNTVGWNGGGMENDSFSYPIIRNSIFWDNTAATAGASQMYNDSSTPVLSYSVVKGGCPVGSTCTKIIITDPLLGALGNHGGFTQTIPLLSGSSAINAGNDVTCAAADQRGVIRPQGAHCDIGAFEVSPPTTLVNSVLPTSRTVPVGSMATIFNTVINAGVDTAYGVTLSISPVLNGAFTYQQTNCATNAIISGLNPSLDLAPGSVLCYVLSFTPGAAFAATSVHIRAQAENTTSTNLLTGINTWLLRATNSPGPDIIALTTTADFHQAACSGTSAFAVALSNVGAAAIGDITVTANTGIATLPLSISISETNPGTGTVIGDNILQTLGAGENRSVAVFVTFKGCIGFDPAANRIFIEFKDAGKNVAGSTSTAVSTNR